MVVEMCDDVNTNPENTFIYSSATVYVTVVRGTVI